MSIIAKQLTHTSLVIVVTNDLGSPPTSDPPFAPPRRDLSPLVPRADPWTLLISPRRAAALPRGGSSLAGHSSPLVFVMIETGPRSLAMPTPSQPAPRRWIVTLSANESPAQMAERLRARGFVVDQVLEAVGVITGQAGASTVEHLKALPGLQSIEPDQPIQLPDPGAGPTW